MVHGARHLLAVASAAVVLRILVACSTSGKPAAPVSYDAAPGEAFTACQIQGYVSESEGGLCPEGTCPVLAFDTNGAQVPCCTSIASGPGMCVDGSGLDATLEGGADGATEADAEGGTDGAAEADAEGGTDGAVEADAESGAAEASTPPDAADAE